MSFAGNVKPISPVSSCVNYPTAGSKGFVGQILRCEDSEPGIWSVATDALALNATSVSLYIDTTPALLPPGAPAAPSIFLQKGKILYFGAGPTYNTCTLAEPVLLTAITPGTAQSVKILPLPSTNTAIAAKTNALTFEAVPILSMTLSGITDTPTNIDTTNQGGGTRYAQTYLGSELGLSIGFDMTRNDYAVNKLLQNAKEEAKLIYFALVAPGGYYSFGPAFASRAGIGGPNKDIRRGTYNIMFQQEAAEIMELSAENNFVKTQMTNWSRLMGIAA
jgi:hypothetical protein